MYIKRNYGFWMTFKWSKRPFILGTLYALMINLGIYLINLTLYLPWQPLSIVGIAVAFYLGFKNNSSYDRTWEARKIWGSIVNNSRSFGAMVCSFVQGENENEIKTDLIYRHLAWMTALRHQLRLKKEWEHDNERLKNRFAPTVCEDFHHKLKKELLMLMPSDVYEQLKHKSNMATQLLNIQSQQLQLLCNKGYFDSFRHMEFQQLITNLYADQGKSERIKNFPFPRQYASTALWMTFVFSALIPFGLADIFKHMAIGYQVISCLLSGLIIWIFFLMEKIGDYSENPFEGSYNNVPITTISRGIEIDLREMLNEENIPKPIPEENGFQL